MKKSLLLLTCLATLVVSAFNADKVRIVGKTNKSALSYAAGEEMIFTFSVDWNGEKKDGCQFKWKRYGDDGKQASGTQSADSDLVVKTSLNQPGFVRVDVFLADAKGKKIRQNRKVTRNPQIGYYAGAAVQPEVLTDCGEPADFDEFWAKQKARLQEVPFIGKVETKCVQDKGKYKIYSVVIPCAGPRPVTGYLTIPKNAAPKSQKVRLQVQGYGCKPDNAGWAKFYPDTVTLEINAHGQPLGVSKEELDKFFESIRSNGQQYAFDPVQNRDPETAFFNGMTFRVLRALEYLKSLPEWNGKDVIVYGGSQGGLQTMWAVALDSDVTEAYPSIVWCCDRAGQTKKGRDIGTWFVPYVPALDYYDPVFHAKRIKKAKVVITRAGLGDHTCPPSGLAILYRNLATPDKSIHWVQGSDHGYVPKDSEVIDWQSQPTK